MEISEMWVPVVMFISLAVVLSFWLYFRFRVRREFQETVRSAINKGQELSPDVLDRLGQPRASGNSDLRRGLIAIAIGAGLGAFGFVLGEEQAVRPLIAAGALPFLVGVAYLALWRFGDNRG
ncbi:hypothetical protein BH24PSE2_BH24PSE2_02700 [soil metagenome]